MNMKLRRIAQLTLCLVALAATPALAQETTPASEADRALLNEAANKLAVDSYRIELNANLLVGEAGRATEPVFRLTGTVAVDARAEMAEGEFTITSSTGEVPTIRFILSGETIYISAQATNQWTAFFLEDLDEYFNEVLDEALDEAMANSSISDDVIANLSAALNDLNIAPYSTLWRLPDEDGLRSRLRTSFDLRSFLTGPQIGNLFNALVTEEMESEIGMTREQITSLLPLLLNSFLQETQLEIGYQIAPQSGELLELSVDMNVRVNPAMMSSESAPLELRLSLVAVFSGYDETNVDGQPPTNAEIRTVTLEELQQSMTPR